MRFVRRTLRVVIVITIFLASVIGMIDRSSFSQTEDYQAMMSTLDHFDLNATQGDSILQAGWAKVNITPSFPVKLVGYQPRGPHTAVHDSLYARVMYLKQGQQQVAIISLDLLIFPPLLRKELAKRLPEINFSIEQTYLSASHTHTGFGGWDNSPLGGTLMGGYNQEIMEWLSERILQAITQAKKVSTIAELKYQKIPVEHFLENRLDKTHEVDHWIRLVQVTQVERGKSGVLLSFSAHATNINKNIHKLSGDYPNVWVNQLEKDERVDFGMYCAGMVGSHRVKWMPHRDFEKAKLVGDTLAALTRSALAHTQELVPTDVGLKHIPVKLPASQLRLTAGLKVRNWAFEALMGKLEAAVTVLKIGELVMIGMPCDFSGEIFVEQELDELFAKRNREVMITSFNGFYVGYITADEHYNTKAKEEVRVMNWVGPNMGAYFTEIIKKIAHQI
ncbi:MAG: neutral/alkaline non-lysosomal ceramidase N-terminal domain-containing protein [Flammeovirgaceae bacterium]